MGLAIRIFQKEFLLYRCPIPIPISPTHKYESIVFSFACPFLYVRSLEVGQESMEQRLPVPVGMERDSCLLSQPPSQLEFGPGWSSHGPSDAPVFRSGDDAVRREGKRSPWQCLEMLVGRPSS